MKMVPSYKGKGEHETEASKGRSRQRRPCREDRHRRDPRGRTCPAQLRLECEKSNESVDLEGQRASSEEADSGPRTPYRVHVDEGDFCRIHRTIRCAPAMEAGLTDTLYDTEWLMEKSE